MPIGWNDSAMTPGKVKGLHHLSYLCHKNPIGSVPSVHDVDFADLVCARNLMCKDLRCMLLCKNKFQYKCMCSCEMFPSVSQITYDVSEKQCLAKIEINAHFFPTLILLIMH